MKIRYATPADKHAVHRIVNSTHNRVVFGFVMKVVLEAAAREQAKNGRQAKNFFLVAERRGEIVGFLRAYHRNDGQTTLHELGVREDCQSDGIGTVLVERLLRTAKARRMEKVALCTPVGSRSNRFYPRFGFRRVGTREGRVRRLNVYALDLAAA